LAVIGSPGQLGGGDLVGAQRAELGLLLAVRRGVDAGVRRLAELAVSSRVVLLGLSCR
jgi:hypothetical protein